MTLLLLRHADAGVRSSWTGDDRRRPLSAAGRRETEAIVDQYRDRPLGRILSSPYRRCLETVEPLARARRLPVEEEDALAEGTPPDLVWRLIRRLGDGDAVLCTHGDVVEAVLTELHHRGVVAREELRWPKAGTWVLDGGTHRTVTAFLPPPVVP